MTSRGRKYMEERGIEVVHKARVALAAFICLGICPME
jgi:hypothetical protein